MEKERFTMKNKIYPVVLLVLMLVFVFCSCEENSEPVVNMQNGSSEIEAVATESEKQTEADENEEISKSEDMDNYTKFY